MAAVPTPTEALNNGNGPENQRMTWSEVGSQPDELLALMTDLYWTGVKRDILEIIRTLRTWCREEYDEVMLNEDQLCVARNHLSAVTGFETFLSRATVADTADTSDLKNKIMFKMQESALRGSYPRFERMAHMLLQAAAFLDIDKLLEYRPPLQEYDIWTRPRAPQLCTETDNRQTPRFRPLCCSSCSTVIRGTHFRCLNECSSISNNNRNGVGEKDLDETTSQRYTLCETCARNNVHPHNHLRKLQKHCAVTDAVSASQSQLICLCYKSFKLVESSLFPFRYEQREKHYLKCELRGLMAKHAIARYADIGRGKKRWRTLLVGNGDLAVIGGQLKSPSADQNLLSSVPTDGKILDAKPLLKGVLKPIVRNLLGKIPFGNVHMAVMFGPLIIENGVPDSNSGVRISVRDSLKLSSASGQTQDKPEVVLSLSPERIIYKASTVNRGRRLKACMKQVVGGAFCEIRDVAQEHDIIKALAEESRKCVYEPLKRQAYDEEKLNKAMNRIVGMLRILLEGRVTKYLEAIIGKLFDSKIQLKWDVRHNHCQRFCEAIIDYNIFGNFISTKSDCRGCPPQDPLYLVSFVCPSGSYDGLPTKVLPKSKKIAPNGLTEEYLFRFYKHGHHDESDIFDTLLEYWYDWGAFGTTIFRHQQLLPWDCTEACQMGPKNNNFNIKCNYCSTMKHVWAFPFDAWSLIQLHIFRERRFYTPKDEATKSISDVDWMRNRLSVFDALQALNIVASAMIKTKAFRESCQWVNSETETNQKTLTARSNEGKLNPTFCRDRSKLAGILRAQPQSHYFEQDKYHECTLAGWADLVHKDQVDLYIKLRDFRADKLDDVPDLYKASASIGGSSGISPDPGYPDMPAISPLLSEIGSSTTNDIQDNYRHTPRINDFKLSAWNSTFDALIQASLSSENCGDLDSDSEDMKVYEDDDLDFTGVFERNLHSCTCDIDASGKHKDLKDWGSKAFAEAQINPKSSTTAKAKAHPQANLYPDLDVKPKPNVIIGDNVFTEPNLYPGAEAHPQANLYPKSNDKPKSNVIIGDNVLTEHFTHPAVNSNMPTNANKKANLESEPDIDAKDM